MQIKIRMRYHLSEWLLSKSLQKKNVREDMKGMQAGTPTVENSMEIPLKTKNKTTISTNNSSPRIYLVKNENINSKRYLPPNVHSSPVYNSQDTEAIQVSSNRQMDKENFISTYILKCIYIYTYTYVYFMCVCMYI